jgi:DNA-binding transcriptional regulator YbjK
LIIMATSKGEQRRAVLAETAVRILVADGIEGLNHRAVSARAEVAVGLVTYYFPTVEDLRRAAVDALAAADLARMQAVAADVDSRRRSARATALVVTDVSVPGGHHELVAWYERYVRGGREPLLAGYARQVNAAARGHVATVLDRCGWSDEIPADVALAVVDGAAVGALAEGGSADDARAAATRALTAVLQTFGPRRGQ